MAKKTNNSAIVDAPETIETESTTEVTTDVNHEQPPVESQETEQPQEEAKENISDVSQDVAGSEPEVKAPAIPSRILSEEDAKALVAAKYKIPEGVQFCCVTEDRNVFWQDHESSAYNHAQRNNLKIFRIPCQA